MEAPKLPSIFKHHGPRAFQLKPRYYDERKERIEELKKKYEGKHVPVSTDGFREKINDKWRADRSKGARSSNMRLIVIIAILFLLTYLILLS